MDPPGHTKDQEEQQEKTADACPFIIQVADTAFNTCSIVDRHQYGHEQGHKAEYGKIYRTKILSEVK